MMALASPKAAYEGDLEAVNERGDKVLSELFEQSEFFAFLFTPNLQPLSYRKWKLKEKFPILMPKMTRKIVIRP